MPKAQAGASAPKAAKAAAAPDPAPEGPEKPAKTGKVPSQAVDPGDLGSMKTMDEADEYLKLLWWGPEGTWKTSEIATAANRGKLLVVNAEGGFKKKPLTELGVDISNIVLWPDPESGVEITYATMEELFWRIKAKLLQDPGSFYAVAWDSASDIYSRFVSNVRAAEFKKNAELPVQKRKDFRLDPFFTDRGDYGVATEQLRQLLRWYRDLPCHFLVSALERRDQDEETYKVTYGPAVGPAFQRDLLGYLDVIISTKVTTLQTGPDPEIDVVESGRGLTRTNGKQRAKDRFKSLPRVMANPTFERILDYVEDRVVESEDPVQKEFAEAKAEDLRWAEGIDEKAEAAAAGGGNEIETAPVDA